jgi:hypothetical protein
MPGAVGVRRLHIAEIGYFTPIVCRQSGKTVTTQ